MANANISKISFRRTGPLRVIEGTGVKRQPLDLINFTIPQLRALLGEEYGPRLSDESGEQAIALIRRLAGHQVPPLADDGTWTLDKARAIAEAQPDTFTGCDWDVTAVVTAASIIDGALSRMVAWWDRLPPNEEVRKGQAALAQFVGPFAVALPYLGWFLPRDYEPPPSRQIGPEKKNAPWRVPAVTLANNLDRGLRRPGDSKLPPFWSDSKPTVAVHAILTDLDLQPPTLPTLSSYIRRWWGKPESGGRLPLGATDGPQSLREAALKHATTPAAAAVLNQLDHALLVREAEVPREEQLRHGTEEKERLERLANPTSSCPEA